MSIYLTPETSRSAQRLHGVPAAPSLEVFCCDLWWWGRDLAEWPYELTAAVEVFTAGSPTAGSAVYDQVHQAQHRRHLKCHEYLKQTKIKPSSIFFSKSREP